LLIALLFRIDTNPHPHRPVRQERDEHQDVLWWLFILFNQYCKAF